MTGMKNKETIPWWHSIKNRLLIFGIVMSIIPMTVFGYFYAKTLRNNLQQNIYYDIEITTQRLAADLESLIGGQIKQVFSVANVGGRKLLTKEQSYQEGLLYNLLQEAPYLEEISLVGADGQELARASRRLVVNSNGRSVSSTEAFQNLAKNNLLWSETFLDKYGQVRLKRIIPIHGLDKGEFTGGLILEISLREIIDQLTKRQPEFQGRLFVVDSDGKLIGHQDFSQVLKKTDVRFSLPVKRFTEVQGRNTKVVTVADKYISYDGKEVLGDFSIVNNLGWAVVQEVPVSQAFAPVNQIIKQLLVAGGVLIFFVTALSIFFGINFNKSFRRLEHFVEQIRYGNLKYTIQIEGKDELSKLGETLDNMREELLTRRQQEEALRQAEKLSSLGLMAAGVAHEINNPLAIMSAYAEDLQERIEEEEIKDLVTSGELSDYLEVIVKQTTRCKGITSNLLDYSRQSGSEKAKLNLKQVVESTLMLVEYRLKKERVLVDINIPQELPPLSGNVDEVQQVLLNIVTNALDSLEPSGQLIICARLNQDNVELEIEDNGSGIKPENMKHIFDPFFTTKEPGKGTGLGLSICYNIMQRMGGYLELNSNFGEGTKIKLMFPYDKEGSYGYKNTGC